MPAFETTPRTLRPHSHTYIKPIGLIGLIGHIGPIGHILLLLLSLLLPPSSFTQRPVVLIHGFMASGDTWARFQQQFVMQGYDPGSVAVLDWNTLNRGTEALNQLDALVDSLRARTGAAQVDLVGHSAGGGLSYQYLSDSARAAKVAHYAHIGSMPNKQPACQAMLNLWSDGDKVAQAGEIPGAENRMLPGLDHYQVATAPASFEAVFEFFNERAPVVKEVAILPNVTIGGRALVFGENTPAAGAEIECYYLDPASGQRQGALFHRQIADLLGYWSAPEVKAGVPVEIVVRSAAPGSRPVHYFRRGFWSDDPLVYLRVLPAANSMLGFLLNGLPKAPEQSVVNIFAAGQAVVNGRDQLLVNGTPLSTETLAAPEKTAISFFLYDADNNRESAYNAVGVFARFPFLVGADCFLDPADPSPLRIELNGKTQMVRKIPSSEGVQVVVFE